MEKSARTDYLTTATTGGTTNGARTRLSAAAMTFIAGVELLDFNFLFGAKSRFLQVDPHVVTQVRPALPILCMRVAAAEKCLENSTAESGLAENLAENIERIMETSTETGATLGKGSVAEPVIGRAFIRVHKNIIRFPKLLKFFLSVRVVRIFVWMKLDRELAISAFDFLFGCVSPEAKHFVIIAFLGGHLSKFTLALACGLAHDQTKGST